MSHDEAAATATRMNELDSGVLRYTVLSVGDTHEIVVTDMEGRELGLL